jgi:hypothetical protein
MTLLLLLLLVLLLTPCVVRVKMQNSWLSGSTSGTGGFTCTHMIAAQAHTLSH